MKRLFAIAAMVGLLASSTISEAAPVATDSYIVVLADTTADPATVAAQHGRHHGFAPTLIYRHALKGYAARLSPQEASALEANPSVLFVAEDGVLSATAPPSQPPQMPSTAIFRIDADESSTASADGRGSVKVNVAILDTGPIDTKHPDLRAKEAIDCVPRDSGSDPGHGTMVGGFVGALDNKIGKVGVAPGATLWGARVLDSTTGEGSDSEVICGIDWVTSTRTDSRTDNDIAVANMSLGGEGDDDGNCGLTNGDPLHLAICNSVAAGVTYVVAAGNEAVDIAGIEPAGWQEVLTVTAMADRDGQPGGLGGQFMCDPLQYDDTVAYWSNFATLPEDQAHTVSASGVCISSTFPGGQYGIGAGTSFSAPSVSGVVALCIVFGECAGLSPQQIVSKIVADASAYNIANPTYGYEGDPLRPGPDRYYGYLVHAAEY